MKRDNVIKIISEDLQDINIENYYDEKGSEWCANLILIRLEENGIVNKLYRNSEDVLLPEQEMVKFWQGFVEGQSKALQFYSKKVREQRQQIKDLQSSLEAVLSDDGEPPSDFSELLPEKKNE